MKAMANWSISSMNILFLMNKAMLYWMRMAIEFIPVNMSGLAPILSSLLR